VAAPQAGGLAGPASSVRGLGGLRTALIVAIGSSALVAGFTAADGGYFPTSWGWAAVLLCWAGALALVLTSPSRLTALEAGTVLALFAYTAWTAASIAWSDDPEQSVLDVERRLVYVVGLLAVLLLVRRRTVAPLLGGALVAISGISAYALSTRLFSSRGAGVESVALNRLAEPIGYWNGLAVFAVMGILLALGFATRARRAATRGCAAAGVPLLATTLYFTYSRGGWLALAVGLFAVIAMDTRRLQQVTAMLVLALPSAAAVWLASQSHALTSLTSPYATMRHDGRILMLELALLCLVSAGLAIALEIAEANVRVKRPVRIGYAVALVLACTVLVGGLLAHYGGPLEAARDAYHSFEGPPKSAKTTGDFNTRLFSLSSNGRLEQWRAAWRDYQAHRWLGSGSGSFESYWLQHRTTGFKVRDAHSLYLETLAELGPLGLGLLLVALLLPLAAAVRARHRRLVPAACAAYVAFLIHAGVDWDWELAAVSLTGLLVAGSLLVAARGRARAFALGVPVRGVLVAALIGVAAFSVVGLVGNRALASSTNAVDNANWARAERKAHTAIRWAPWSAAAWQNLGDAQLGLGKRAEAIRSLRRAARKNPRGWSIWYDLAVASSGAERRRAFLRAEALNPLSPNIAVLRRRGWGR
jgi:O-antigen ligase